MPEIDAEKVEDATIGIICLSMNFGGVLLGIIAEVALKKALEAGQEHWVACVRTMRESLISKQAEFIENGTSDEEQIEHFAKHMRQVADAVGLD